MKVVTAAALLHPASNLISRRGFFVCFWCLHINICIYSIDKLLLWTIRWEIQDFYCCMWNNSSSKESIVQNRISASGTNIVISSKVFFDYLWLFWSKSCVLEVKASLSPPADRLQEVNKSHLSQKHRSTAKICISNVLKVMKLKRMECLGSLLDFCWSYLLVTLMFASVLIIRNTFPSCWCLQCLCCSYFFSSFFRGKSRASIKHADPGLFLLFLSFVVFKGEELTALPIAIWIFLSIWRFAFCKTE